MFEFFLHIAVILLGCVVMAILGAPAWGVTLGGWVALLLFQSSGESFDGQTR
jgi:hypothetical protein